MYNESQDPNTLPNFITIAGIIGAGKTTLADNLGKYLSSRVGVNNVQIHHEKVDTNELLPLFYKDMKRWGFALQVSLLTQRHRQLQRINWSETLYHIEDRFMDEDHVFAATLLKQGNMTNLEHNIYKGMVSTYEKHVSRPDLIVFLDVTAETSFDRIKNRGREMEQNISLNYLESLHNEYQLFIKHISKKIPVIQITWEQFQETEDVAKLIIDLWDRKCFNITTPFDSFVQGYFYLNK